MLNGVANALLTPEYEQLGDPDKALVYARRACILEEGSGGNALWKYLDTLALAQHRTGDTAKAIETQRRAIWLIPESEGVATQEEFAANLRTYEAALPEGAQGGS